MESLDPLKLNHLAIDTLLLNEVLDLVLERFHCLESFELVQRYCEGYGEEATVRTGALNSILERMPKVKQVKLQSITADEFENLQEFKHRHLLISCEGLNLSLKQYLQIKDQCPNWELICKVRKDLMQPDRFSLFLHVIKQIKEGIEKPIFDEPEMKYKRAYIGVGSIKCRRYENTFSNESSMVYLKLRHCEDYNAPPNVLLLIKGKGFFKGKGENTIDSKCASDYGITVDSSLHCIDRPLY